MPPPAAPAPPTIAAVALLLAAPMAALLVLLARPGLDGRWQHHPSHLWIVLAAAAVTGALAYAMGGAARRRGDARVLALSIGFLAASAFLGLHALATPGVLVDRPSAAFAAATPVGLVLAGALCAAAARGWEGVRAARAMRVLPAVQALVLVAAAAWGVLALTADGPLSCTEPPARGDAALVALGVAGAALYLAAAAGFARLWWRRRGTLPALAAVAMLLLAETMVAVAASRTWQASWWEWHVLILAAFGLVAAGAHLEWHEERFGALYLDDTAAGRREMSVLFADLAGFTTFCERSDPAAVSRMLDVRLGAAVTAVTAEGGDVDRLIGDAVMVVFNRAGDQPDHAARAVAAARALQRATAPAAGEPEGWPRFRVGVNTGEAVTVVLGTRGGRTHTVLGDAVNVAARLEGLAPVGGVVVAAATAAGAGVAGTSLGGTAVKGRAEPVEAVLLDGPAGP